VVNLGRIRLGSFGKAVRDKFHTKSAPFTFNKNKASDSGDAGAIRDTKTDLERRWSKKVSPGVLRRQSQGSGKWPIKKCQAAECLQQKACNPASTTLLTP